MVGMIDCICFLVRRSTFQLDLCRTSTYRKAISIWQCGLIANANCEMFPEADQVDMFGHSLPVLSLQILDHDLYEPGDSCAHSGVAVFVLMLQLFVYVLTSFLKIPYERCSGLSPKFCSEKICNGHLMAPCLRPYCERVRCWIHHVNDIAWQNAAVAQPHIVAALIVTSIGPPLQVLQPQSSKARLRDSKTLASKHCSSKYFLFMHLLLRSAHCKKLRKIWPTVDNNHIPKRKL